MEFSKTEEDGLTGYNLNGYGLMDYFSGDIFDFVKVWILSSPNPQPPRLWVGIWYEDGVWEENSLWYS